jgi:hypothetical protein
LKLSQQPWALALALVLVLLAVLCLMEHLLMQACPHLLLLTLPRWQMVLQWLRLCCFCWLRCCLPPAAVLALLNSTAQLLLATAASGAPASGDMALSSESYEQETDIVTNHRGTARERAPISQQATASKWPYHLLCHHQAAGHTPLLAAESRGV